MRLVRDDRFPPPPLPCSGYRRTRRLPPLKVGRLHKSSLDLDDTFWYCWCIVLLQRTFSPTPPLDTTTTRESSESSWSEKSPSFAVHETDKMSVEASLSSRRQYRGGGLNLSWSPTESHGVPRSSADPPPVSPLLSYRR